MGNIIVDATELVHWNGKLTGVLRVMDELSTRFASNPDCIFIEWSEKHNVFYQVDLMQVLRDKELSLQTEELTTHKSTRQQLVAIANKLETRVPAARPLLKVSRKAVHTLPTNKKNTSDDPTKIIITPKKGDVFVIICDWHERPFVDKVVEIEQAGTKLVIVAHDMLPFVTPQFSGHATERFKYFVSNLYPRSSVILANSESTKRDTAAWLEKNNLKPPNIVVMRLGDDFQFVTPKRPEDRYFQSGEIKEGSYILCVGTVEARKNHTLLYYVYKLAKQKGIQLPPLIVVGRRGWKTENIYDIICDDPETNLQIIFLHNTGDEELAWLYDHCLFSIYPSFYEGWGLPIAESIAHGVPCVSSNTSSMPEIAGDLITYFSPDSSDECLSAIVHLLKPENLSTARKKLTQYEPTTWNETFETVQNAIGDIHAK